MPRIVKRTRNCEQWTEARYQSFIKSALRAASRKWGPKNKSKQLARIDRGIYLCAGYKKKPHKVKGTLPPPKGKKKRIDNAVVDHIKPVVDPVTGFVSWDDVIERMFCELDGFQILCHDCHTRKTADERIIRNENRRSSNDG